ncbi:unnamed protein product [Caretta caretta]
MAGRPDCDGDGADRSLRSAGAFPDLLESECGDFSAVDRYAVHCFWIPQHGDCQDPRLSLVRQAGVCGGWCGAAGQPERELGSVQEELLLSFAQLPGGVFLQIDLWLFAPNHKLLS